MIILDIEATGLLQNDSLPLTEQPHIVELAAKRLSDKTLKATDKIEFMCDPGVPLPKKFMEITGITEKDVKGKKKFATYFPQVVEFFNGERTLCAHNVSYDVGVLAYQLQRLGMQHHFPWPVIHLCTVELTHHFKGHRLNLLKLYEYLGFPEVKHAHRAMGDVDMLVKIVKELRKMKVL